MRLCRFERGSAIEIGFYADESVVPLQAAADACGVKITASDSLLSYLPGGDTRGAVVELQKQVEALSNADRDKLAVAVTDVSLLVPVPVPSKLLLLAGNYAKHIEEGGGRAEERAKTFPYVFMKPPLTTLTDPGRPVRIPAVSRDHVDWE